MTSEEYKNELLEQKKSQLSLENHVRARLRELVKIHPEAIVIHNYLGSEGVIKAKALDKSYIDLSTTGAMINIIAEIEKWSEEQQGITQEKIKFD